MLKVRLFDDQLKLRYGEAVWDKVKNDGDMAQEDRKVQEQPLYFDIGVDFQFNHRKLTEPVEIHPPPPPPTLSNREPARGC